MPKAASAATNTPGNGGGSTSGRYSHADNWADDRTQIPALVGHLARRDNRSDAASIRFNIPEPS
ncbi:MAG: hypothetical protein R3F11_02060 [Verrucomicrobiales bacterium]